VQEIEGVLWNLLYAVQFVSDLLEGVVVDMLLWGVGVQLL
jgi:hypothetical protein